ncbi:SDR family NAD(P)-dependent oxidoreductase [Rhodoligotrophos defluvii]|uniref:SDR family NAD(P)-dependent oxidoreductase n=1 Tax=Rhodoligotrophos defluvii TaxID=2561934 RepID=UPI0010C9FB1C|nr:SDR family oxidoreductase [Rhodoligotrophos defluvii]
MNDLALQERATLDGRQLDGRIAVVTGSDSGIGQAIASAFAAAGADIAVTFHTDENGARETAELVEQAGRRTLVRQLDVRDEDSVETLFGELERTLGAPHILVNNAGVGSGGSPVAETSTEAFDNVLKTDLYGPFFCCRAFIRRRQAEGGSGKIINITSVHDTIPSPRAAAYGAAKGGLLTFTRSLALEVAPTKINVNAISPGLIHTPMTAKRVEDPETRQKEMPHIPWHRPGEPWEVARLALYLASNEADYVTGQNFTIDGGLEMNWGQGA